MKPKKDKNYDKQETDFAKKHHQTAKKTPINLHISKKSSIFAGYLCVYASQSKEIYIR